MPVIGDVRFRPVARTGFDVVGAPVLLGVDVAFVGRVGDRRERTRQDQTPDGTGPSHRLDDVLHHGEAAVVHLLRRRPATGENRTGVHDAAASIECGVIAAAPEEIGGEQRVAPGQARIVHCEEMIDFLGIVEVAHA